MLVNYTAVCCSWYVWKGKSLSQPRLRYRIFAESAPMLILSKTLSFFSLKEHFSDILSFFFDQVLVIGLACPHWQYSRMFSVSLCKFELCQHHRKSLARSANFQLYMHPGFYGLHHILQHVARIYADLC